MQCKNCHYRLSEDNSYCSQCGGKIIRNRLTLKNLFEHITETFFNYDNKLFRTLRDLTIRPHVVIDDYVSGIRMRYVNPISLFALSLTIAGLSLFIMQKFYADAMDFSGLFRSSGIYTEDMIENINNSTKTTMEYSSLIYSALVPLFAIMSAIIFYDKRYNFTEHVILYLYSMSILSIFSVLISQLILLINPQWYLIYGFGFYVIMFGYHAYLLTKLFKLSFWSLVLRSMMFFFLFFMIYVVTILATLAVGFYSGAMNIEDFKPKTD